MKPKGISEKIVEKMVELSKLTIKKSEMRYFIKQFNETITIIQKLNRLNTSKTPGTDQVTNLENVYREDEVNKKRMLTQRQALSNANKTHKGYFLTKAIFDE